MCCINCHIIGDIVEQSHCYIRSSIKMELYWWSDIDKARVERVTMMECLSNCSDIIFSPFMQESIITAML